MSAVTFALPTAVFTVIVMLVAACAPRESVTVRVSLALPSITGAVHVVAAAVDDPNSPGPDHANVIGSPSESCAVADSDRVVLGGTVCADATSESITGG